MKAKRLLTWLLCVAMGMTMLPVSLVSVADGKENVMDNYVIYSIYEKKALTATSNGYGNGWAKGLSIDCSGVAPENLALSLRLYIRNEEDPADLSILQAPSRDLKLSTAADNTGKNLIWKLDQIKTVEGGALQAGEWNDILLPFSTANGYDKFDFSTDVLTFYWLEFGGMTTVPNHTVRMMDVAVVDTSREKQEVETVTWDTTYAVGDLAYSWSVVVNGKGSATATMGKGIGFQAIDASRHDPKKLRLLLDIEVENLTNPGDVSVLSQISGQLELTSSGKPDVNEQAVGIQSLDWHDGKNEYSVNISSGSATGGTLDYSNINFMRIYMNGWPAAFTDTIKITVSNVRLVDISDMATLPTLFSDGMMFQQNKDMNLWGYTQAGTAVTANLYKGEERLESKQATADDSGRWDLAFAPRAGGYDAYTIEVLEGDKVIKTIRDVLVGEVWIASGQSNMALTVSTDMDVNTILEEADNPYIRMFLEPTYPMGSTGGQPLDPAPDVPDAVWGYGNNKAQVSRVSSVGYTFAKNLQEELDVPVAIINASVGGSVIEAWLSREAIESDETLKRELVQRGLYYDDFFWPDNVGSMATLYNQKIGPLEGMNVAGVIWYQGESNSNRSEIYDIELDLLKKSWSKVFGYPDGDMPLIFTQVAPHRYDNGATNSQHLGYLAEYMERGWALSKDENTAMITIYDLPLEHMRDGVSSDPIHPRVKTPVGERFFESAMNMVYGGGKEYTAPVYKSMEIRDNAIYLTFDRVGDGLRTTDGTTDLHGFAIAGENGVYVAAEAQIVDKTTVKVWNNRVANPKNAMYAFDNYNQGANLCNAVAIPASPFRTVELDDTTTKPAVSITYFTAQDWMTADKDVWVYDSTNEVEWKSGYRPSFAVSDNAQYGYNTWAFTEGVASLQVDYTGTATVSPITTYESLKVDYSKFTSLSVKVLNPDAQAKSLSMQITVGSKTYTVAAEGDVMAATLAGGQKAFSTVTFDLTALYDEEGTRKTNAKYLLKNLTAITFTIEDTQAGRLLFDAFSVGTSEPVVPNATLDAAEETVILDRAAVEKRLQAIDAMSWDTLPESWLTDYTAARAAVDAALKQETWSDYEITAALAALEQVVATLSEKTADSAFVELYQTVAKLVAQEIDASLYTPESVAAYKTACDDATALLKDTAVSEEQLRAMITRLQSTLVERKALFGDANGDGKVSTADAALALQYAAELIGDDAIDTAAADVNGDGKVTTADAALMLQYAAELIDTFPAERTDG